MRFHVLGPLEAVTGDRVLRLGGIKQRSVLGYLLLQLNQVVSTRRLIEALWSVEEPPESARKILQNAVWGLRSVLSEASAETDEPALLRTRAPGYVLQARPEQVDLHVFQQQVEQGRTRLAERRPQDAAQCFRRALDLWRGTVLADLAETGVQWPELTMADNMRLGALEDYFEAELACGRHHVILGELEKTVKNELLRERMCGQLMLALYRSGRQAEALGVYNQTREALVEGLGLEPGRELRDLQQAILRHEQELCLPDPLPRRELPVRLSSAAVGDEPVQRADPARGTASRRDTAPRGPVRRGTARDDPAQEQQRMTSSARRKASAVVVRTRPALDTRDSGSPRADRMVAGMVAAVEETVGEYGGFIAARMGSVSLALFGELLGDPHGAERALQAAHDILCGLEARDASQTGSGKASAHDIRAAVVTGDVSVRYPPSGGAVPEADGALLDLGQELLAEARPGEIRVCGATRRATLTTVSYDPPVGSSGLGWRVRDIRFAGVRGMLPSRNGSPDGPPANGRRRPQEKGPKEAALRGGRPAPSPGPRGPLPPRLPERER